MQPAAHARLGFALIVALSLMAFMVILLVSLTLLLQVETKAGANDLARLRAREAARLALMMALGDLQRHAGPDRRVTARAEILPKAERVPESRFWTGVWDTTEPDSPPKWLVSGRPSSPASIRMPAQLQAAYDHGSDGLDNSPYDVPATSVPRVALDGGEIQIAWWVSDEGVKAPIRPVPGVFEHLQSLGPEVGPSDYFDYNERTLRSAAFLHDPVFDFEKLFDANDVDDPIENGLRQLVSKRQVAALLHDFPSPVREEIHSEFLHSVTLDNYFVLSNTKEGGLKKDLSYLKAVDPQALTPARLDQAYQDPDGLITPEVVRALYLNADPVAGDKESMMGMRISRESVADTEAADQDFSILPVVTECQLSAGLAADDLTDPGQLYLVHKLYLELWNPYTAPFILGKKDLAPERGYSDLRIEISGLPGYALTNLSTGEQVSGSLPDLSYLFSRDSGEKIMRPGMVFYTTMPRDNAGAFSTPLKDGTGTFHTPLGTALSGVNGDDYQGEFSMTGPITIRLLASNSAGKEKEIYTFEIGGYPDFVIDYRPSQRATWFHRRRSSVGGQFGMNHESLERPGYAFGFRFKRLDTQASVTSTTDLSNWLSLKDPRHRSFSVDLGTWDIDTAWTDPSTPPYDFRLSSHGYDPGYFEPGESFKGDDFFAYQTSGTGRKDRVARVFNLATAEPAKLDLLNGIYFPEGRPNPIGSPWGGGLNAVYDRYFFSTLPSPSWTGDKSNRQPLLNARIKVLNDTVTLETTHTAEDLMLQNGFNLNSTSALAWEKILNGHRFSENEVEMRYELGNYPDRPDWFPLEQPVRNGFFKFPEAAAFNATEQENDPRYEILLKEAMPHYDAAFRIDSIHLHANRQHPSFLQSFREMDNRSLTALGQSIVKELREFYVKEGRPPFSMDEYISSGLLQDAIDATPEINQRSNDFDEVPAYSPASIDQRTVFNALGSFSTVRTDSFEITARADVTDPASGEVLETAMCRATVQRMPDEHPNPALGRKFRILQFEWLKPGFSTHHELP